MINIFAFLDFISSSYMFLNKKPCLKFSTILGVNTTFRGAEPKTVNKTKTGGIPFIKITSHAIFGWFNRFDGFNIHFDIVIKPCAPLRYLVSVSSVT